MKLLFPTMSCSSLTDPALLHTPPQAVYIAFGLLILVYRNIQVYLNDRLYSVSSGLSVLACGRRDDLSA